MPMVNLEQIQAYMKSQAEEDKRKKYVQVTGDTLEDAIKQASIELSSSVKKMEYEILEKGSKGTFGVGKKPWVIVASVSAAAGAAAATESHLDLDFGFDDDAVSADRDGQVFLRLDPEGVFLGVSSPHGKGRSISEREAIEKIASRFSGRFDAAMVSKIVKNADGEMVRIADYNYNPVNDAMLTVEIADAEMKAYLRINPPGPGGADPRSENIAQFLNYNRVVSGVLEDVVADLERNPQYGVPVLIATGTKPVNGKDASVSYSFDTDPNKVRLKEKNGKVDFHELNLIKNVVEGQVLAKKNPAQRGEPGRTVTGKLMPAKDGKDCKIEVGKNVRLSDDGMTAVAEINGQVVISAGKLNVEPVYVVPGDINLKTGNILFLGTVLVKGNIDDGFEVKAAGNVEVMGNVGRCIIDAEGDVIVHQGITGKGAGKVVAGRTIWAKFIENASIEAGENVVVSDGLINSTIIANKKILCKGKRAAIVGGHLRSAEEINAKTLGSVAGMETICEVGYDPRSKARLDLLEKQWEELEKQEEDIDLNIGTLENVKKVRKVLPEDKQLLYDELTKKKMDLLTQMDAVKKESEQVKNYLSQLRSTGKVSVAAYAYPGVKIIIRDAVHEIRNEIRAATFINENNLVKVTKYEEPEDDNVIRRS